MKLGKTNNQELLDLTDMEEIFSRVESVEVTYLDGKSRTFHSMVWSNLREGIVENLYSKNKCSIVLKERTGEVVRKSN